uniref:Uncharacterized protein n=1 Tax=Amblyomma cajennense TaxID=34607 RepID=A0A023FEA2_AMBCJ
MHGVPIENRILGSRLFLAFTFECLFLSGCLLALNYVVRPMRAALFLLVNRCLGKMPARRQLLAVWLCVSSYVFPSSEREKKNACTVGQFLLFLCLSFTALELYNACYPLLKLTPPIHLSVFVSVSTIVASCFSQVHHPHPSSFLFLFVHCEEKKTTLLHSLLNAKRQ